MSRVKVLSSATVLAAAQIFSGCDREPAPRTPPVPVRSGDGAPQGSGQPSPSLKDVSAPQRAASADDQERWLRVKAGAGAGVLFTNSIRESLLRYAKDEPVVEQKIVSGSDPLSAQMILSLTEIVQKHCGGINALKEAALPVLRARQVKNAPFFEVVDGDTEALLADGNFRASLNKHFGQKEIDCKEVSTALLLSMLLRFEQVQLPENSAKVRFVAGVCFDPNYAPQGVGHAWVEFDGQVLDWAIRTKGKMSKVPADSPNYIPIAWTEIVYDPKSLKADASVVTVPFKTRDWPSDPCPTFMFACKFSKMRVPS